ncbi:hypothetical protein LCS82_13800 [Vibrio harveyi]|uniref:Gp138 family membrane-puncturing spike protein n=1 Tax=Vibrio harveyi TaxID=669 RepID=UPI000C796B2E|nr:Gp138 family membrane-puncturing spike protein [Vibrio harveyi]AWB00255.1 hypothetical protein CU052_13535 [Vibrio harveyi]
MSAPNSRRPENDDSLEGTFREILRKHDQKFQDMLPAMVISHDRSTVPARVRVRPLISIVDTLGNVRKREEIPNIPVYQLGAGGVFMSFNIEPGDLGWIKANDRDISNFLQSYLDAKPNTMRMHNFSDAVFFPDIMRKYLIAKEDQKAATIQSRDGSVKIALDDKQIRIANKAVRFEVNDNSVDISAPGGVDINGAKIGGDGAISSPKSLSAPSVKANNKELAGHHHKAGSPPGDTGENV